MATARKKTPNGAKATVKGGAARGKAAAPAAAKGPVAKENPAKENPAKENPAKENVAKENAEKDTTAKQGAAKAPAAETGAVSKTQAAPQQPAAPAPGTVAQGAKQAAGQAVAAAETTASMADAGAKATAKASESLARQNIETTVAFTRDHVDFTKDQIEGMFKMGFDVFKSYEEAMSYGKDNVDAVVKSSTIMARGLQDLSAAFMGLARTSFEENVEASKQIMGCKNLKEVTELQSSLFKTNYEKFIKESGKLSENSIKLAEEAIEPVASRWSVAVEKFGKPVVNV